MQNQLTLKSYKTYFQTFGCQMNVADSEYIASMLISTGNFELTNNINEADIIFINTCSVRKHAEDRATAFIGRLKKLKLKNRELKIIVIGCFAQRAKSELQKKFPFVDIFVGPLDYEYLSEILSQILGIKVCCGNHYNIFNKVSTFVPIMTGCNNFCSYCVVPYVRGREKSRHVDEILAEVKILLDNGTKEIILIGQNVNSYKGTKTVANGKDVEVNFAELLEMVAGLNTQQKFWVRFLTNHPKDMNYEIVQAIKKHQNIMRHIHLPLQSGSNRILSLMNRNYTIEKYKEIIQMIRNEIPDISITTDLIVGFPTETEEDFKKTMEAVQELEFDSAFVFKYSPREGTKAALLPDDIPQEVKEKRHNELLTLCDNIARKKNLKYVGSTFEVLIEFQKNNNIFIGKTINNKTVELISKQQVKVGEFINTKITAVKKHTLIGDLV